MKPTYTKDDLLLVFQQIGKQVNKPLITYMFGGGAMAFRNQKQGTKDLDLAFLSNNNFQEFAVALEKSGFHEIHKLEKPYTEMAASGIWENKNNFRLDLFVKVVCNALELTSTVIARSETLGQYGNLTVKMFSNEDLVIFKGITERPADVDDIAAIANSAYVNWDIVLEECVSQSEKRPWHGALLNKLYEIEKTHSIVAPITAQLQNLYDRRILLDKYRELEKEGKTQNKAFELLATKYEATENDLRQLKSDLEKRSLVDGLKKHLKPGLKDGL